MKCSLCNVDLEPNDYGEFGFVVVDICPNCQGAWFEKGELDRLDDSVWTNVEEVDFDQVKADHKDIKCPQCHIDLEPLSPKDAPELIVDRCPTCQGFWLDQGELDRIREVAGHIDAKLTESMTMTQRPAHWSRLRWSVYSFKKYYSQ